MEEGRRGGPLRHRSAPVGAKAPAGYHAPMASAGPCLALYYTRENKHSFVPLIAALESHPRLGRLPLRFVDPEGSPAEELAALARSHAPLVVAVSLCSAQAAAAPALVASLRRSLERGRAFFVAGGPHPTGDPEGTLACGFDAVVVGEGEGTFVDLLLRLMDGQEWRSAAGLAYRAGDGACVRTGRRAAVDLDAVPCFAAAHRRYGYFEITRGCPWGCRFCQITNAFGARPRHRSVERVASEVERFIATTGNRFVRFLTPNALAYGTDGRAADLAAVERLLAAVRRAAPPPAKIYFGSFPAEVRPEFVSPEALALIGRFADNDNIVIGAQSGSDRVLERIRRGHTVRDVYRATELILAAGYRAYVDFIVGLPGEGPAETEESLAAIERLARQGAKIRIHGFMPLPGTPLAGERPGALPEAARERLQRLTGSGRLFGKWQRQRELARVLAARRPPAAGSLRDSL
jgi:B12-binding domain/radical SAM domain protein